MRICHQQRHFLRTTIVMSPGQLAKFNGHDPWANLNMILDSLPTHVNSRIKELLPHRWQPDGYRPRVNTCALIFGDSLRRDGWPHTSRCRASSLKPPFISCRPSTRNEPHRETLAPENPTWMAVKCRDSAILEADIENMFSDFGSKFIVSF